MELEWYLQYAGHQKNEKLLGMYIGPDCLEFVYCENNKQNLPSHLELLFQKKVDLILVNCQK